MLCQSKAAHGWVEVTLAKLQAAWGAALGGLFKLLAAVNERHRASATRAVLIFERNIDFLKFLG